MFRLKTQQMKIVSFIEELNVIEKILRHLDLLDVRTLAGYTSTVGLGLVAAYMVVESIHTRLPFITVISFL